MKKLLCLSAVALGFAVIASASPAPTAYSVLQKALVLSKREHKPILLDFGASWCPWCMQYEKLWDQPKWKTLFAKNYIMVSITVTEVPAYKDRENKGWEKLMAKYRPTKAQDIPYLVFLDPKGKKLADSYEPYSGAIPGNAGFPQTPDEIEKTIELFAKTGSYWTKSELDDLKAQFVKVREQHSQK